MRRRAIRHDEGCPGGDDCECEDNEDCDDDEYCDEDEGECVEREDGADGLRDHLQRRYRVDLASVPAMEVTRRAATILGVSLDGMSDAAAISLTSLRADGEWSEDDHPRAENGEFSGAGGASQASAKANEASTSASTVAEHSKAMDLHRQAESAQRGAGSPGVARSHAYAAEAHEAAAQGLRVGFKDSATARYAEAARLHSSKAMLQSNSSDAKIQVSRSATAAANAKTDAVKKIPEPNVKDRAWAHNQAMHAHRAAAQAATQAGDGNSAAHHEYMAETHERKYGSYTRRTRVAPLVRARVQRGSR